MTVLYPTLLGPWPFSTPIRIAGDFKIGYKVSWMYGRGGRKWKFKLIGHDETETTRPKGAATIEAKLEGPGMPRGGEKYDFPLQPHLDLLWVFVLIHGAAGLVN